MCDINKLTANEVVSMYIRIRDAKKAKEAEMKATLKPYDEALSRLEGRALAILADQGAESLKTPAGTVYQTQKVSIRASDREAFMDYVKENQAFELLDVRPNKTAVEEYAVEHSDLPPGISKDAIMAANFRRA